MTCTLTVTAKGQVTLKKELLKHLGVAPGQRIIVDLPPSGRAEISAAKSRGSIEDFIGFLGTTGVTAPSIDELNKTIAKGWAGRR